MLKVELLRHSKMHCAKTLIPDAADLIPYAYKQEWLIQLKRGLFMQFFVYFTFCFGVPIWTYLFLLKSEFFYHSLLPKDVYLLNLLKGRMSTHSLCKTIKHIIVFKYWPLTFLPDWLIHRSYHQNINKYYDHQFPKEPLHRI